MSKLENKVAVVTGASKGIGAAIAKHFAAAGAKVLVKLQNGKKLFCWMYAYNRPPGATPPLPSGDYSKHRNDRNG